MTAVGTIYAVFVTVDGDDPSLFALFQTESLAQEQVTLLIDPSSDVHAFYSAEQIHHRVMNYG